MTEAQAAELIGQVKAAVAVLTAVAGFVVGWVIVNIVISVANMRLGR